jgi:hypothetical protein
MTGKPSVRNICKKLKSVLTLKSARRKIMGALENKDVVVQFKDEKQS